MISAIGISGKVEKRELSTRVRNVHVIGNEIWQEAILPTSQLRIIVPRNTQTAPTSRSSTTPAEGTSNAVYGLTAESRRRVQCPWHWHSIGLSKHTERTKMVF